MILSNKSKLNSKIILKESELEYISTIKNYFKISLLTAKILANKNIPFEKIEEYLNPSLKKTWPDITSLLNIEKATEETLIAIKEKKIIGIISDYDVDGISSSVILKEFFDFFNIETHIWIPERADGYGASEKASRFFNDLNVDLIFMLDCGTNDYKFCKESSKKIIIIDHHNSINPTQEAILLNPNAQDFPCESYLKEMCAAALTFVFTAHILKKLNEKDNYRKILDSYIDLVALATICDMMPLNNFNKALVKQGIIKIEKQERVGLSQIINISKIKLPITSKDLSFFIGPRINASGRIESPMFALNLLKARQKNEIEDLIYKLEQINNYRKQIQEDTFKEALELARKESGSIICLAKENWNIGIVGIVAAMIQKETKKSAIIGSLKNGEIKASARSSTINIGYLIQKACEEKILEKGGGHKAAAGLTCKEENWNKFKAWINQQNFEQIIDNHTIYVESIVSLSDINTDYKMLAPFGLGNEEPKVAVENISIKQIFKTEKYCRISLEENYSNHTFFLKNSDQKLIEIFETAFKDKSKLNIVISLQEKGLHNLEDAY